MSPRASLPGAEELFRRTAGARVEPKGAPEPVPAPTRSPQADKSTKLQVAEDTVAEPRKPPKHDEKVTFYCTAEDLMALERARLKLRADHRVSADRGRIVRAALAYVLEDFEARAEDSILLRRLESDT